MDKQTSVSGPLPNSYWVTPGSFAAGGYPGAGASYLTTTRFKALVAGRNQAASSTSPRRASFPPTRTLPKGNLAPRD